MTTTKLSSLLPPPPLSQNHYQKKNKLECKRLQIFPHNDITKLIQKFISLNLFTPQTFTQTPCFQIYDLDLLDYTLQTLKQSFGPTSRHRIAMKSNSITGLIQYFQKGHNVGVEAASMGEVQLALRCGVPYEDIVFDSPCKTVQELEYCIVKTIHCNLDNLEEVKRAKEMILRQRSNRLSSKYDDLGVLGLRINPLVGKGDIEMLSVSTLGSKFGVEITRREEILNVFETNEWLNCLHVHVGSGNRGCEILEKGIRKVVDLANDINKCCNNQIQYLDIGGGMPVNYLSDDSTSSSIPCFDQYAQVLKQSVPELFSGQYRVLTEFGQSVNAKAGLLLSKIEYVKGSDENPILICHFGADCCPRQVYASMDHERRIEVYKSNGERFEEEFCQQTGFAYGKYNGSKKIISQNKNNKEQSFKKGYSYSIGGPLCFQGDFVAKNIRLPYGVAAGDFVVMKDAGAYTLSLFSRYCSRYMPAVYGFRWEKTNGESDGQEDKNVGEIHLIKPQETMEQLHSHWGPLL